MEYEGKDMDDLETFLAYNDITDIYGCDTNLTAIRENNTVISAGDNTYGQRNVQDWTEIMEIAMKITKQIARYPVPE